jgi:hypothetical protein
MSKHPYQPIDDHIAGEIAAIHKKYPKLGHHGILSALEDDGIRVDPQELERFMAENHVDAEKPFKPMKFRGAPSWLGGDPRNDQ